MESKNFRRILLTTFIIGIVFFSVACKSNEEGMVAIVDGKGISAEELEKNFDLARIKEEVELRFGEGALEQEVEEGKTLEQKYKEELLEKLVLVKIITKNAQDSIDVTEEMVEEQVEYYINELGGEEKLNKFLSDIEISLDEFKELINERLLSENYQKSILDSIEVTDEEAEEYFNENRDDIISIRLQHILVNKKEEAEEILKELKEGKDFSDLAMTRSIDISSGERGGDIGYITKNSSKMSIGEYKDIGFNLQVGEISEVIESELGYSIIKVTERNEDFQTFKDKIIEDIKSAGLNKKIEEIKGKSKYKLIPENIILKEESDSVKD